MAQDRPEFKLYRLYPPKRVEATDDFERRSFANVAALLAVVALVVVAYWSSTHWGTAGRFQRCLDSGRVNCVDFVNPAR